ncbi:hypothetical protein JHK84_054793 [Glycine max]|uniref:Uncharacterized protein n=1 Tax=Glycine soja TaxID=3848 RepID=A0A445EZG8_GLYSO|nr:hypothetical protein JHK86_054768 [Glycine max]KAG5073562.1 hypothetical protein JHK84_054793 [Glycine max]KAH1034070.1 hypothetical protein GYH30_054464 [Glycine max]RZB41964.1 hypothetical protein D0Y65_052809 [Glycine soja]
MQFLGSQILGDFVEKYNQITDPFPDYMLSLKPLHLLSHHSCLASKKIVDEKIFTSLISTYDLDESIAANPRISFVALFDQDHIQPIVLTKKNKNIYNP